MSQLLIVFARYPEEGKCKTRLIPEVGPTEAANIHRDMTHWTLDWARQISAANTADVLVCFYGGTRECMQRQFGNDLLFTPQVEGSLGEKLRHACLQACANRYERAVVVGTDCPQLTADIATQAFEQLESHSACIAPAADGGYTLLGLRLDSQDLDSTLELLFEGIDWGTERVLSQTLSRLASAHTFPALLPTLRDVDHPEDLTVWEQAKTGCLESPLVSVIVPTHNEESGLDDALQSANDKQAELIVVGAGTVEASAESCRKAGSQFLNAQPNRSQQMNAGASVARGRWLLFLHADCTLPPDFMEVLTDADRSTDCVGGAFRLSIDSSRPLARWVEWGVARRTGLRKLPYGDQAIFVRRDVFERLGGYPDQPIMEDYVFARRLRRAGELSLSESKVTTSSRRWHNLGFLRTTWINQLMIIGYHVGFSPERLATFYRKRRSTN